MRDSDGSGSDHDHDVCSAAAAAAAAAAVPTTAATATAAMPTASAARTCNRTGSKAAVHDGHQLFLTADKGLQGTCAWQCRQDQSGVVVSACAEVHTYVFVRSHTSCVTSVAATSLVL
jgi:hypothetical protein